MAPRRSHGPSDGARDHSWHASCVTSLRSATFTPAGGVSSARGASLRCSAGGNKKKGLFDEMLDVMEGGPKLRRWYGQDSSVGAPGVDRVEVDAPAEAEEQTAAEIEDELRKWDAQPRRATLVTDANTPLGEAVIMQLIVAKQPVTALGVTTEQATMRYGPYVTAAPDVAVDDAAGLATTIRKGVRAIICTGGAGAIPQAAVSDGKVKHVVLVSAAGASAGGGGGIFDAVFGGEEAKRRDPGREAAFTSAAVDAMVPLTIIRPGKIKAGFGGKPLEFSQGDKGAGGEINVEDAAEAVVRCLGAPPAAGKVLAFEVRNGAGAPGEKRDWRALFGALKSD